MSQSQPLFLGPYGTNTNLSLTSLKVANGVTFPSVYSNTVVTNPLTVTIDSNGVLGASAGTPGSGTVTSVIAGTGLSGGIITSSGTIAIATTGVTPASYTNTNLTVNAQGQITSASNGSGGGGSGTVTSIIAGNQLTGGTITTSGTIGVNTNLTVTTLTSGEITSSDAYTRSVTSPPGLLPKPLQIDGNTGIIGTNIPITLTGTLQFFGDSIAAGTGANPSSKRWTTLLCAALSQTENNQAVPGSQWVDSATEIYNNFTNGQTTFLSWGTNDVSNQFYIDQIESMMKNAILYTCLPRTNIKDAASGTKVGTWSDHGVYSSIGTATTTLNGTASITFAVIGRYICWTITCINSATVSNQVTYSVSIDGTIISVTNTGSNSVWNVPTGFSDGLSNQPYCSMSYIYDTGNTSSHSVVFIPNVTGSPSNPTFFLDWVGSFNQNLNGCNTILVSDYGLKDLWTYYSQNVYGFALVNLLPQVFILRLGMKRIAENFRNRYGLPVYFMEDQYTMNEYGELCTDYLHPNNAGHAQISNRAQVLINNIISQ